MKNRYKDLLFFAFFRNYVYLFLLFLLFTTKNRPKHNVLSDLIYLLLCVLFLFILPGKFPHHAQTGEKSDQVRQNHKSVKHI